MSEPLDVIEGRYVLHGELASGGMATVHLGRQLGAGGFARTVAIKRLHARYAKDPAFVGMFLDEARVVARVRHPNVVQTLDVVATDKELFLVMDYVHGESLLALMRLSEKARTPVPVPVAKALIVAVLAGLHAAHEATSEAGEPLGVVHRDVSPHNVLVGADGVPRVLDFGIAKAQERVHSTQEGDIKGKLSYMTAEQIRGLPVDRRTDVFATAIVLWELLTGQKLFDGENQAATMHAAMFREIPPPSRLRADVDASLDAIVMRGLERDPARRFASAAEMAQAIERTGGVASASELAAWVRALAGDVLARRAATVAAIESRTPSGRLGQADIERAISSRQIASLGPTSMPPIASGSNPGSGAGPTAPALTAPPPAVIVASRGGAPAALAIAAVAVAVLALGGAGIAAWRLRANAASASATPSPPTEVPTTQALARPSTSASGAAKADECPEGMVAVPGGKFFMGSDDDLPDEKPAHQVTLKAFCLDRVEVTTSAYKACSDRGECKRAGATNKWPDITAADQKTYDPLCNVSAPDHGEHPINCVDWEMADRFCRAAGKRLPTEAEWEFAARGSDGRRYPWGDATPSGKHLNACGAECVEWGKKNRVELLAMYKESDGFATTAPVGSFPEGRSRFGADDLVGNVWEWTSDWYGPYAKADVADPAGPEKGTMRVIRGGAWNGSYPDWVRPTFRFKNVADARSYGIGFRCAK